ncbi:uncharacterized protein [Aegilops tauschii subsp. strangulata]|uniref:uncharacterized protein isoform X3 n=1 Tax=Aegilops tauschii subsp. strangulata TaxID=200361 RepID=UPI001ABC37A4|nr:uncharacterized protein LOC120964060 isoform X3 [Aegilops tauschii subsp. strangulata]XP_044401789.1 uncharacterized protein LOC123125338 isoform X3 [Triticum aestivum]
MVKGPATSSSRSPGVVSGFGRRLQLRWPPQQQRRGTGTSWVGKHHHHGRLHPLQATGPAAAMDGEANHAQQQQQIKVKEVGVVEPETEPPGSSLSLFLIDACVGSFSTHGCPPAPWTTPMGGTFPHADDDIIESNLNLDTRPTLP